VEDEERILVYPHSEAVKAQDACCEVPPAFERAGPRRHIFFDPEKLNCGIVTCGGLCPGLNDVIRTITLTLAWQYGVKTIFGFKYGYLGLSSKAPQEPVLLTPQLVDEIHLKGGDILS
jgi:6-phosphofructokinase 1